MTNRNISPEALERIERKLFDVCSILLSAKHVLAHCDDSHTATAVDVLISRAGAIADSAIIKDFGVCGCCGNDDEWANHVS